MTTRPGVPGTVPGSWRCLGLVMPALPFALQHKLPGPSLSGEDSFQQKEMRLNGGVVCSMSSKQTTSAAVQCLRGKHISLDQFLLFIIG